MLDPNDDDVGGQGVYGLLGRGLRSSRPKFRRFQCSFSSKEYVLVIALLREWLFVEREGVSLT